MPVSIYSIVTYSRDKPFSQTILQASRNSKLYTLYSKLDSGFSKASSIEDRVSNRDCQLTFEQYCRTTAVTFCLISIASRMTSVVSMRDVSVE